MMLKDFVPQSPIGFHANANVSHLSAICSNQTVANTTSSPSVTGVGSQTLRHLQKQVSPR